MNIPRFSTVLKPCTSFPSRRTVLRSVAALGLSLGEGHLPDSANAKPVKKHRKHTLCQNGTTVRVSKKKKKKLLKRGATPGDCPAPDGACPCGAGTLCVEGTCQRCTVTCNDTPERCGDTLQEALAKGGTVYACPGRYVRNFSLATEVTLIGAGDGMDPLSSTILDARGNGRVVEVGAGVTGSLSNLRITDGSELAHGGGIRNDGTLTLTRCTVDDNRTREPGSAGGGIGNFHLLTLNACTVSRNTAATAGGGIYNATGCTLTVRGSVITGNRSYLVGGLYNSGTTTFDNASSVTGNTALAVGGTGGINSEDTGSKVTLNGANVSGNSPNNCASVPECNG